MSFTDEVKSLVLELGADLVGVAPIERFEGSPEHFHPQRLLPQTKSVMSIAIRHLNGVLVPQRNMVENFPYQTYGYGWVSNIRLNWVAFEISRFLEDNGHTSRARFHLSSRAVGRRSRTGTRPCWRAWRSSAGTTSQ